MLDGVHFTGGEISGGIHYNITLAEQCGRYFTTQTVKKWTFPNAAIDKSIGEKKSSWFLFDNTKGKMV